MAELMDKMDSATQRNTSLKASVKDLTAKVQNMEVYSREVERTKENLKTAREALVSVAKWRILMIFIILISVYLC